MNCVRYLILAAMAMGFFHLSAAEDDDAFQQELNERDWDALKDFLRTKQGVDVAEKANNLSISGDVRFEWRHMTERCGDVNLRGSGSPPFKGLPVGKNDFDIECNVRFEYDADKAWAVAHIQYDNSAGVSDNDHPCSGIEGSRSCNFSENNKARDPEGYHGSGICDRLCLKRAYMGYTLFDCDGQSLDIELGRRNLYNVFDSKIQFLSRFDGILFHYIAKHDCFEEWFLKVAGFVVDERVNHFAWATEIGFMNICESNIDFKYSFIDWKKRGRNRCYAHNPRGFRFTNSQWSLTYHLNPDYFWGRDARVYGAFLWNSAARATAFTEGHHLNTGWYLGLRVGEVYKEGDWSFLIEYQVVGAQAMPDDDMSGIGRGNLRDESFTSFCRRGNTNFRGVHLEGLYAFTDNLTIDTIVEWSTALYSKVGGSHEFSKVEVEAIYAF